MNLQEFSAVQHQSERLSYTLYEESDLKKAHSLFSLPETDIFNALGVMGSLLETESVMLPLIEALEADSISSFTFVVTDKSSGQFIGLLGMNLKRDVYRAAELWYKIMPEQWGKGYATETLSWMLTFGFESLDLHRIAAGCSIQNVGSYRVMEKAGMRKEGTSLQCLPLKSGWSDTYEYAMLDTEYHLLNKKSN